MIKRKQKRRGWLLRVAAFVVFVLAAAAVGAGVLWHLRIGLASRWVRSALDREGLADVDFRLTTLAPGRIVIEDVRWGTPAPAVSVDCLEIRFSYPDVTRGWLDRVRIRGIRTPLVVKAGRATSPLVERVAALAAVRAAGRGRDRVTRSGATFDRMGVGELSVSGAQVAVTGADGETVLTVAGDLGATAEPGGERLQAGCDPDRYRLWARLGDDAGLRVALTGAVVPDIGQVSLEPEVKLLDIGAWFERLRRVLPDLPEAPRGVSMNRSLALQGRLTGDGWTDRARRGNGEGQGRIGFTASLARRDETVAFDGEAVVTGGFSNTVWQATVRVPEFSIVSTQEHARVQALAGMSIGAHYGAGRVAVNGEAWLRDVRATFGQKHGAAGEAGIGRIGVRVDLPECDATSASNAVATAWVGISNGWIQARSGSMTGTLEGLQGEAPVTWSARDGLVFPPGHRLSWQRLEANGVSVTNKGFTLESVDQARVVRLRAGITGSRITGEVTARFPNADPRQVVVGVSIPETDLASDDGVAALLRKKMPDVDITGRVSAEASLRLSGGRSLVTGRLRMADGTLRGKSFEARGMVVDVPLEYDGVPRTTGRPLVSFVSAQVGNIRLDQGTVRFQLVPDELVIDRMEVGCCKGSLNAYSVHLNLKNPRDDFVVYADRIDMGEALMMAFPFKGKIDGVLYGRVPVGIDRGRVKLYPGFLYSLPGQGGKIVLDDNRQMLGLLEQAGIRGDVQAPLSKALSDMDLSAIKMDLAPRKAGDETLSIRLTGKSNYKEWPAPVDLSLNLNGPIEGCKVIFLLEVEFCSCIRQQSLVN